MRCADLTPTPGRRRSASIKPSRLRSATERSERELHAGNLRHAGAQLAHLLLRGGLDPAHRVVDGRGHQVFEHVLVVCQQAGVDGDALDVVLAGHLHLHQAGAGFTGHLHQRQFVLGLLQVVLHRLGLLHQAGQLVLHHDGFAFGSPPSAARGLIEPGTMRAVRNCAISSRTTGSLWMRCSASRCAVSRAWLSRRDRQSCAGPVSTSRCAGSPSAAPSAADSLAASDGLRRLSRSTRSCQRRPPPSAGVTASSSACQPSSRTIATTPPAAASGRITAAHWSPSGVVCSGGRSGAGAGTAEATGSAGTGGRAIARGRGRSEGVGSSACAAARTVGAVPKSSGTSSSIEGGGSWAISAGAGTGGVKRWTGCGAGAGGVGTAGSGRGIACGRGTTTGRAGAVLRASRGVATSGAARGAPAAAGAAPVARKSTR